MIRFILADLRRLWAASLVIVLLVALASALGVGITLQERALRLGSARAADKFDLVIGAAGSETQLVLSSVFLQPAPLPLLPGDVLAKLKQDPRVAFAAPIGFGDSFKTYPVVGSTPDLINALNNGAAPEGRAPTGEHDAVIGSAVDLAIGQSFEPMHGAAGDAGHVHTEFSYQVVGRLMPTGTAWDRAIIVPIEAVFPGEVLTRLYATLGDARQVMSIIAIAAQMLVAAAIALIAIAHVFQRRRQIGALRAFGAPRSAVFGIVWSELLALMGTGIALGFLVGWAAVRLISDQLTRQNGVVLPVEFQGGDLGLAFLLLVAAAAIAAVPALLAYRQPAVAALRS